MVDKMCNLRSTKKYMQQLKKKIVQFIVSGVFFLLFLFLEKGEGQLLVCLFLFRFDKEEHIASMRITFGSILFATYIQTSLPCPVRCCYNEDSYVLVSICVNHRLRQIQKFLCLNRMIHNQRSINIQPKVKAHSKKAQ